LPCSSASKLVYLDETKLMQTAREASEGLTTLFEADREEGKPEP
jgi:hypothetical protein